MLLTREFEQAASEGDGRHAYVNEDGAFLGHAVPLLERDALGWWQARENAELERLLATGYGRPIELGWRAAQLRHVAQALNGDDLPLARMALLRTELPPLPSDDHARAMAEEDSAPRPAR